VKRRALSTPEPRGDCRCHCGSLLARLTGAGVELKCRRCKRTLLVPLPMQDEPSGSPPRAARFARLQEVG
jgi:hypothetical protein